MKPFNVFPYDSNINFIRMRWVSLAIALLMALVAIGSMATKGFNFALDFTEMYDTVSVVVWKEIVDVIGERACQ